MLTGEGLSPSSATASSALGALDPHELDRLPRRKPRLPKVEAWVGEPDSPRVVIESRRCWLAWECMGWVVGTCCFEKRSVKGRVEAREARLERELESGTVIGEDARSLDMTSWKRRNCVNGTRGKRKWVLVRTSRPSHKMRFKWRLQTFVCGDLQKKKQQWGNGMEGEGWKWMNCRRRKRMRGGDFREGEEEFGVVPHRERASFKLSLAQYLG